MVARAEARKRWRGVVLLTLLVGAVGAVVLATTAGARRTSSALARFNAASHSASVQVFTADPTDAQLRAFRRSPDVVAVAVLHAYYLGFEDSSSLTAAASADGAVGTTVNQPKLVTGRLANPRAANEITIGQSIATQLHRGVGDHLGAVSYTPAQSAALSAGAADPGPPGGPHLQLRIVGVIRQPVDLGRTSGAGGLIALTPAFDRTYAGRIGSFGTALLVVTRHGDADVQPVTTAARTIFGASPQFSVSSLADDNNGAQSAIDVLTIALWIFAGVAALAGLVTTGIIVSREIASSSLDEATLLALGLTRRQRIAVSVPTMLIVAIGGAALALIGAVVGSPLFPIGVARLAEPHLGLRADTTVLFAGAVAIVAVVAVITMVAARRATRPSALHPLAATRHRRNAADVVTRAGLPPSAITGVRMAVQRGTGRTALPVLSAFAGAVVAVLGITAVLVYGASFGHVATTPRLYGWTWDFKATDTVSNESSCSRRSFGLLDEHGVGAAAAICYGQSNITLDGRATNGWAFVPLRGTIGPEILSGRSPHGAHEVALGSATLRALGKHLGDRINARGPYGRGEYRIVGETVFPNLGQSQPLADGAAFTGPGFAPLFDQNNFYRYLVGRFAPGSDPAVVEHRVAAIPELSDVRTASDPVEIDRLSQIDWTPVGLAIMLGALALVAVGHALVTAVHRRGRDLAILKTLGFTRAQARATISWQATTLASIGLVIGIPAGLIVGRLVWQVIADGLGVTATPEIPTARLLLTVVAVLVVVNVLAIFPAAAAARTSPADVLRTE